MSQLDHWAAGNRHETNDSLERTGLRWAFLFAVFVVVSGVCAFVAYLIVAPRPFAGPLRETDREIPTQRLLQDNATNKTDIATLRQHENQILSTAGPSAYHPGARRIPLDQALDQIAAQGLPAHPFRPGSYRLAPSADRAAKQRPSP